MPTTQGRSIRPRNPLPPLNPRGVILSDGAVVYSNGSPLNAQNYYMNNFGQFSRVFDEQSKIQNELSNIFKECTIEYLAKENGYVDIENTRFLYDFKDFGNGLYCVSPYYRNEVGSEISIEDFKKSLRLGYKEVYDFENRLPTNQPLGSSIRMLRIESAMLKSRYVPSNENMILQEDNLNGGRVYINLNNFQFNFLSVRTQYGSINNESSSDIILGINNESIITVLTNMYNLLRRRNLSILETRINSSTVNNRRPNTSVKKFIGSKLGKYVNSSTKFSCEIECYGKNQEIVSRVSRELPKELGVSKDGSLTSNLGFPVEFQTPILSAKRGEIFIAELCNKLVDENFKADITCGVHIHLDGGESLVKKYFKKSGQLDRPTEIITLYLFYRIFEPVIVSFLPSTRRSNRYCSQFTNALEVRDNVFLPRPIDETLHKIKDVKNISDFEKYWYRVNSDSGVANAKDNHYTISRYFGANFHSLLKENHFEVRYHSWTFNYEKILYWIDLHANIVDVCSSLQITEDQLIDIHNQNMDIDQLTNTMLSLLKINQDTLEYLLDRQKELRKVKVSDEILISKTKGLDVC